MTDPETAAANAEVRRSSFGPPAPVAVSDLTFWQRFHVKLTTFYGAFVLVALAIMTGAFYAGGVKLEMDGIRARLAGTTVAIARGIDLDAIAHLKRKDDRDSPAYQKLLADFSAINAAENDLLSIYVLVPTEQPGIFRFAFDFVAPGKRTAAAANVGQLYDATKNARLQLGLNEANVETEIASDEWGDSLSGYAPIIAPDGKHIGLVGIDGDARAIRGMKREIFLVALLVSLVAAGVLGVAGFFVGRNVQQPLGQVIRAASAITAGHLETRVGLSRDDEFGILGDNFDHMAAGLQERDRIRATFGRYVSEDVAKQVLGHEGARMGGEVREVTVLFSDLRGYGAISESLTPTETVDFLNEYLRVMNLEIDKESGVIIEFLGDAILAVFGAPKTLESHPEHAVRCAIAMRAALLAFDDAMHSRGRAPWRNAGQVGLGLRIGIHTGDVIAGNLGSDVRLKYAVIGDTVNVASRVEGLNNGLDTDILITSNTRDRLSDELKRKLTDRGTHKVKGRANELRVYSA